MDKLGVFSFDIILLFPGWTRVQNRLLLQRSSFSSHWFSATKLALRVHPITLVDGDRSITAIAAITFVQ